MFGNTKGILLSHNQPRVNTKDKTAAIHRHTSTSYTSYGHLAVTSVTVMLVDITSQSESHLFGPKHWSAGLDVPHYEHINTLCTNMLIIYKTDGSASKHVEQLQSS